MNLMLMNVVMCKVGCVVCLFEVGVFVEVGFGLLKLVVLWWFKVLIQVCLEEWMVLDLLVLDFLVIQIDGFYMDDNFLMFGVVGVDVDGCKYLLGVVEGVMENVVMVQVLFDNLIDWGFDLVVCCLFIVDGVKVLMKVICCIFGVDILIQCCQIYKVCNIIEWFDFKFYVVVCWVFWQVWELNDVDKVEWFLCNLVCWMEFEVFGVLKSIFEGFDEIFIVICFGLLFELCCLLVSINIIELMNSVI